jgi:hypothetical protein
LSPDYDQDRVLLALTSEGRFLSDDLGDSWREISEGLPEGGTRQVIFSPDYGTDQLMYAVGWESGVYKRLGDSPWMPVEAETRPPQPAPTPTGAPIRAPTSTPEPAAIPTEGSSEPGLFGDVWQVAGDRMGTPVQAAEQLLLAEQPFEGGTMIWDSSGPTIYVLLSTGTWQAYDDTYVEGVDVDYDPALPPPPQQPQRGFGKVWREKLGGPESLIGWALEGERGIEGWRQAFEKAILFWTDEVSEASGSGGTAYVLFDDGTLTAVAAPRR